MIIQTDTSLHRWRPCPLPKRVVSEKELTACYGLMFSEYPDIVNIRQLQAMLGDQPSRGL